MKKILVGGTGRAGTSLLSRMFAELGLRNENSAKLGFSYDIYSNAGYEQSLEEALSLISDQSTILIKTPWIYQLCEEELFNSNTIAFVIIPVRKPFISTVSRCINEIGHLLDRGYVDRALGMVNGQYPGSLFYSTSIDQQETLSNQAYVYLSYWCAAKNIPIISIPFPSAFEDPEVLASLLDPALRFCSIPKVKMKDWIANNYNESFLSASADDEIDADIRDYLVNLFSSNRPPDGLLFLKGLEKLIRKYKLEIDILKEQTRFNSKHHKQNSFTIKKLMSFLSLKK